MQYLIPDSGSILNALYIFQNGWTFLNPTSIGFMSTGGWQDSSGDNKWTNIRAISGDDFTGVQLYYNQEGTPVNFGATGLVNLLLKVRDTGADIASQAYTVYQRTFQKRFSQFSTNASSGGVDTIPMSISDDPLLTIDSAELDTYDDLSITWGTVSRDAGDGAGAKNYGILVETNDPTRRLTEIYNWIQYQLTLATDIDSALGGHIGKITDPLVDMSSATSMITRQGVWIEGFSAEDSNDIVYTDSAGVAHTPPLSVPVKVNVDGAGYQVSVFELDAPGYSDANYTPDAIVSTILNELSTAGSVSDSITYTADVPVRVTVRKAGYQQFSLYATITNTGLNVTSINGVDGAY